MEDFDFVFSEQGWPVATRSNVPEEFVRMLAAARVTYQLANKSIDHVYRTYLKDAKYSVHDGDRQDYKIERFVEKNLSHYDGLLFEVTTVEPKRYGEVIGEWTLLRVPFSSKLMLMCANRGAFFESLAIARSILEQIAWASAIDGLNDRDEIIATSATKSISSLKVRYKMVGEFYGWLSDHAHWAHIGHAKAFRMEEGRLSHLFANPLFKVRSLLALLLLVDIANCVLRQLAKAKLRNTEFESQERKFFEDWDEELPNILTGIASLTSTDQDSKSLISYFAKS